MINDKHDIYIVIPLVIIVIITLFSTSEVIRYKDNMREAEVKYNCHVIQLALERYAYDNGGLYPAYLFGGERDSWNPESSRACQVVLQDKVELPPPDPLLDGGYLSSYPDNAFVDPGEGRTMAVFWTGGRIENGYGDPRFGYTGEIMGNCLNDPINLWSEPGKMTNFANTILDNEFTQNIKVAMVEEETPDNPFYAMGGKPQWPRKNEGRSTNQGCISAFWAGEFFYRAGGPPSIPTNLIKDDFTNIWDYKPLYYDRYLLGGYGSPRTKGIDCVRLTDKDGYTTNNINGHLDDTYNIHPTYGIQVHLSTPEVFGGGWQGWLPTFPYYDENNEWIYGAPDGYPDGVIILLVPGGTYKDYTKTIFDQQD